METILETQALSYIYGANSPGSQVALKGIDLKIQQGEFVGLIGHTGSGKSTLIQHLNGLLTPTSGKILFHGQDIHADKTRLRSLRFKVGLVFQYPEYQLFEETVERDVAFGPRNMGLSDGEVQVRVSQACEAVGLSSAVMKSSPFDLSGGQKRRVAIAGVIAMNPEVLILDEPTAGLDPSGSRVILRQIQTFREQSGTTVILVSHSMEDVALAADRLLVLAKGQLVMDGTPEEVFDEPDRLEALGLDIPQITKVFRLLEKRGIHIDTSVYTVRYGAKLLLKRLEEEGRL